jgi:hypothetical protein
MSVAAVVLSIALAAKLSPAPAAPASRRSADWAAYNRTRAQVGLLPRKAARGTTAVSPSLVSQLPSTATSLDAGAPVVVAPPEPRPEREDPVETPPPSAAQRAIQNALRAASAGRAPRPVEVLRDAPAAAAQERAGEMTAGAIAVVSAPAVEPARAVLVPLAPAAPPPEPEPARAVAVAVPPTPTPQVEAPRVAAAQVPRRPAGAQVDTEGGPLRAGLDGVVVDVRFVARVGSLTFAVERPAVALR